MFTDTSVNGQNGYHLPPSTMEQLLGDPITKNYRPSVYGLPAWSGFGMANGGRWFDLSVVDVMLLDPTVALGIQMLEAPIRTAEGNWTINTDDDRVRRFIDKNLRRVWKGSISVPLLALRYGYSASEVMYMQEKSDSKIYFDRFSPIHPRDARALTDDGHFAGVRILGGHNTNKTVPIDLAAASRDPVRPAKGFWIHHGTSFNMLYGRSRLISAWLPWRDLTSQDGALDIVRMFYYKYAFTGIRIRHPEKDVLMGDGKRIPARDYARQIGELHKVGAAVALPNTKNPRTGEYDWMIEDGELKGDASGLIDYIKYLEGRMTRGLLIPDNVVTEGAGTGAYSGRKVPEDAFYTMEEGLFHDIIMQLNEQIIRPLVAMNFGHNVEYELETKPLVPVRQQQAEAQAGAQGAALGGSPDNPMSALVGDPDAKALEAERNKGGGSVGNIDNKSMRLSMSPKVSPTVLALANAFVRLKAAA